MTEDRKKEIRFKMWALAQGVMTETANMRAVMPGLIDEEYEYARTFLLGIVGATQPGGYRELDDDEIEQAQTDYARGVVDGSEINVNILSELTASIEEQRKLIRSLRDERDKLQTAAEFRTAARIAEYFEGRYDSRFVGQYLPTFAADLRAGNWRKP